MRRDIPGYPGYKVSHDGAIYSYQRKKVRRLRCCIGTKGYYQINLMVGGKPKFLSLHRAVALAWVSGYAKGLHVNHKNGIVTDNSIKNLEWVTRSENALHQRRVLKIGVGNDAPVSKYRPGQVLRVVRLRARGLKHREISASTGVPMSRIAHILTGRSWNHLTGFKYAEGL